MRKSRRRWSGALVSALLLAGAAAAQEGPRGAGILILYPNAPGTPESAKPVMERFGAYLSQRFGAPLEPAYFNDVAEGERWLEANGPRFAILSLALYLQWREEKDLTAVALSERSDAYRQRFHLLVRNDSPHRRLEDLAAAGAQRPVRIWSSHLDDERFATNVVFDQKLTVRREQGPVQVVSTDQPLRALRRLKACEPFQDVPVDAVLVDDVTWAGLQRLKTFKDELRVLYASPPLHTPPVVALPGVDVADAARLRGVLVGMAQDAEGQKLLHTLQVTGFGPPDAAALDAAAASYARELP